jgi:hypothetical protein
MGLHGMWDSQGTQTITESEIFVQQVHCLLNGFFSTKLILGHLLYGCISCVDIETHIEQEN